MKDESSQSEEQGDAANSEPLFPASEPRPKSKPVFNKQAYLARIQRAVVEGAERALKRERTRQFFKRRARRR